MNQSRLLIVTLVLVLSGFSGLLSASAQREPLPPWRESAPSPLAIADISVGEVPVTVELAIVPEDQSLGLGYRNGLDNGQGMLFLFEEPAELSFWMRGMRFCLDIIWIAGGEIVNASENVCPDPPNIEDAERPLYRSGEPVTHVLEMPAGWLAGNEFGPGTPVELPESLR